ncbi:DUF6958 family protein [Qipengyuania sp. DGS5-3]|uniref:DUF6958 family protein n=1 Tax=Qipengyuania sp. DGS5-3 TaxID=3349632 RepID=UPI0036D364A1
MPELLQVENVNHPGRTSRVNAAKYAEMKRAFDASLPRSAPGATQDDIRELVKPILCRKLFPGGKTCGWWAKTVQLDLEAKGTMVREDCKPLRWHLTD